ncbi:MAG: HEAT repeat domain-containing protein, partial [Actinomycetota bacterium]|nr:HEAT repeat domain-containing protein [Actinomycetota bacterium]
LAGADEMRSVHKAMRLYRKGSPEHSACLRLLGVLGTLAIDPLLEVLADEPDMSVRKSLVELISTIADTHIEEVGNRVTDSRWYVVRNVVSILGATRRAEALPFLGRTVRHSDARVRRETIRALAGVSDALVAPMLISALDDADGQNVQLAARYLGRLRAPGAISALERVALGEGKGNRDQGPRIEAIEALGSIGSAEAIPTLTSLTARKRRLGSGRNRGLAPAAESALAAIAASSTEEGR